MINIVVTALKGGAGVSAVVSGFAQAAAQQDLGVVCIDADTHGSLKYHLGLVGLATGEKSESTASRIKLGTPQTAYDFSGDLLLWDLPRSSGDVQAEALARASAVVLVVPASATSVTMAASVKRFLSEGENRYLLINFDDSRIPLKRAAADHLTRHFRDRVIGRIRQDETVEEAVANLEMLSTSAPYSAAWGDMRTALTNLLQRMEEVPLAAAGSRR
ncbi:cellulose synthase operon protein YhjQ/BcsQ [Brevundimonas sp.]|uniref:cellulose synthase operon protein YhjQ/BcsQ n=1 Tax=Brevundimonas sp. TaxID=1871086 RepID=UPI002FC7C76A